jgi:predicted Zn-dependent protease
MKSRKLSRRDKLDLRSQADSLATQGKHLEACAVLERLAAGSPLNPMIWNDLGVQYEAAGEIEQAFAALRRAHTVDATFPPTLHNLGKFTLDRYMSLQEAGGLTDAQGQAMLADAIGFLNANLDGDPGNVDGHHFIALAYGLLRNEAMARAHLTVAARLRNDLDAPLPWRLT